MTSHGLSGQYVPIPPGSVLSELPGPIERFDPVIFHPSGEGRQRGYVLYVSASEFGGERVFLVGDGQGCDYSRSVPEGMCVRLKGGLELEKACAVEHKLSLDFLDAGFSETAGVDGVEGCLARPGTLWEWFFVRPSSGSGSEFYRRATSLGGTTGHVVEMPAGTTLDYEGLLSCLERNVGLRNPTLVQGPDSLALK